MKRGEIWSADLNPITGSEANKIRPVVLVARNDALVAAERNRRGVVTVVPFTTNQQVYGRMPTLVVPSRRNGLQTISKAQAEQVRSVDVSRLTQRLGRLHADDLDEVDTALRYHLALA